MSFSKHEHVAPSAALPSVLKLNMEEWMLIFPWTNSECVCRKPSGFTCLFLVSVGVWRVLIVIENVCYRTRTPSVSPTHGECWREPKGGSDGRLRAPRLFQSRRNLHDRKRPTESHQLHLHAMVLKFLSCELRNQHVDSDENKSENLSLIYMKCFYTPLLILSTNRNKKLLLQSVLSLSVTS